MAENHNVVAGDCISSLTKKKNFRDWHTIHDDAKNADLKKKRPNPNTLVVGDSVFIPDKVKKDFQCATGLSHKFQVAGGPVKLRLVLVDHKDKPIGKQAYDLTGAATSSGKTPDNGLIEAAIAADATAGTLKVELPKKPAAPAPAPLPPAKTATTYPAPVRPPDFTDADDPAFLGNEMTAVKWNLAIGSLPSFNAVTGVQERLRNLAYGLGAESGVEGPLTQAAVKAFQKRYKLAETGKTADVQTNVRDKHDNQ